MSPARVILNKELFILRYAFLGYAYPLKTISIIGPPPVGPKWLPVTTARFQSNCPCGLCYAELLLLLLFFTITPPFSSQETGGWELDVGIIYQWL